MIKIKLGSKVRDTVSGVVGTATSRIQYLNGCVQYGITPKTQPGSSEITTWNIDEEQIEIVKPIKKKTGFSGGPTRKAPQRK